MATHGFIELAGLAGLFNVIAAVLTLVDIPILGQNPEKISPATFLVPAGTTFLLFLVSHLFISSKQQDSNPMISLVVSLTIPFNIAIAVPAVMVMFDSPKEVPIHFFAAGTVIRITGIGMLLWTVRMFYMKAQGTLSPAPWLETKRLLVYGPYAHTRNPMICGVAVELAGANRYSPPQLVCHSPS